MRYTVGKDIWVIGFVLIDLLTKERVVDYPFFKPNPSRFDIERILFKKLHVNSHHRVSGNWDDTIQYDGFICKDADGHTYHNQYPRASYSQLDSSQDQIFNLEDINSEIRRLKSDKAPFCVNKLNNLHDAFLAKGATFSFCDLHSFLTGINGFICDKDGLTKLQKHEVWPKLDAIIKRVISEFKENTGLELFSKKEQLGLKSRNDFDDQREPTYVYRWYAQSSDGTQFELNNFS